MAQLINARVWLRDTSGWSEKEQEADVRAWCAEHGFKPVFYRASTHDRDLWLRSIRKGDAAILPRLDLLVPPPGERRERPTLDFTRTLDPVRARASVVVDVFHNARSDDAKSWDMALGIALNRAVWGRTMPAKEAREKQARSVDARNKKSVLAKWRELKRRNAKPFKQAQALWKSRAFANVKEAQAALPEELHAVSTVSLDRLFGGRT